MDVTRDGARDIADAIYILRIIVGSAAFASKPTPGTGDLLTLNLETTLTDDGGEVTDKFDVEFKVKVPPGVTMTVKEGEDVKLELISNRHQTLFYLHHEIRTYFS